MIKRRPMEIAMVVMQQGDAYPLQLRGDGPNVGAPGLIGFFGGKVENIVDAVTLTERKETPAEAGCREIGEETSVVLRPEQVSKIGEITVDMIIAVSRFEFKPMFFTQSFLKRKR